MRQVLKLRPMIRLVVAQDPAAVLALARQHRPRLLLADLTLPPSDGDAAIYARLPGWRAAPELAGVTLVALVAGDESGAPARGFDVSLMRPLDVAAFLAFLDTRRGAARQAPEATPA
jgi:CheY-like chemotaxis protein